MSTTSIESSIDFPCQTHPHPTQAAPTIENLRKSAQSVEKTENHASALSEFSIHNSAFLPPSPLTLPHLVPTRHLTLILGHPGTGKSLLALDLAARLSNVPAYYPVPHEPDPLFPTAETLSRPDHSAALRADPAMRELYGSMLDLPDIPPTPPLTVLSSREDDDHTIGARLNAAGGTRVEIFHNVSLVQHKSNQRHASQDTPLRFDILHLVRQLYESRRNPRLLILDPLPAFLEEFDCSHAPYVRKTLEPLLEFANDANLAILGIIHLNKGSRSEHPLHRAHGSNAYTALARSVLLLTHDDLTFNPRRRLLIPLKTNAAFTSHAHAFTICDTQNSGLKPQDSSARIEWEAETIDDHPLLNAIPAASPLDTLEKSQLDLAIEFLQVSLTAGPVPSHTILREARAIGLSRRTLDRAHSRLRIKVSHDGPTNQWLMHLPAV